MGRRPKAEKEGNEVKLADARQKIERGEMCDDVVVKKRKLLPSRKAATIRASPVGSKAILRKAKKNRGLVRDSIALRVKREKRLFKKGKTRRYGDEDNIFFLTEMVKLVGSGVDAHENNRNVNIRELYTQVRKRFGAAYTQRQVYEKSRRLRRMYLKFLEMRADQRAVFENSNKEEIFNLCHQLWGDCGVLRLHLEDEDGPPVYQNKRLGFSLGDAASSRKYEFCGLEGVVLGRDLEIDKGAHAEVDGSVPIVSSIHQDDSHGGEGVIPGGQHVVPSGEGTVVDKAVHAAVDDHVTSATEMHVPLLQGVAEKPREEGKELATQRLDEVLHANNQGLLQALERKCDLVLEGMQARLMTMVSNSLRTRDESSMERFFEMLKPAGLSLCDEKLKGSMHESGMLIPKHLQDRWQRLRAEELKLVSDRLRLMLEVCQYEQANLERQTRHL